MQARKVHLQTMQASRSWNFCFDNAIKLFDFSQNGDEPCIYKKVNESAFAFLVLYVDDILLFETTLEYSSL